MTIETISETNCFGGKIGFYRHASETNHCDMQFSVFVPPQSAHGKVPVLTFLSGLTCTEENFMVKSGAQRLAAELGLMLVSPDTSPRGNGVPDDPDDDYDFGLAAGFYLNATQKPWSQHYHMYDYVTQELQQIIFANFPGDAWVISRRTAAPPGRSAPGGEADRSWRKADAAAQRSAFGGRAVVPAAWSELRF